MNRIRSLAVRALVLVVAASLAAAYFFQSATLAPNQTDEGLLLQYVDDMANGMLPFHDFVDAYGIFNWVFPVLFYMAAGDRVWGVRVWMIVLKVIAVLVTYVVVRALTTEPAKPASERPDPDGEVELLGGHFYGVVAALFEMILLGAQWHSLQTPYAFLNVVPLVLGAWHFILSNPLRKAWANVGIAAVLTTLAIWTKLNTGMYLFAGGLFAYFLWIPVDLGGTAGGPAGAREAEWTQRSRWVVTVAYAVLFGAYIRKYLNGWFIAYLTVPLLLGLGWTLQASYSSRHGASPRRHWAPFALYLLVTATLSLTVLALYYGDRAGDYVAELAGILSSIIYTAPFPKFAAAAYYIGFNEYLWLQLPILVTILFACWLVVSRWFGRKAFGAEWPRRQAQISALFLLVTLHGFVIYARADETHIYQYVLLAAPVLVVLLGQFGALLGALRPSPSAHGIYRFAVAGFTPFYLATLFVIPTADAFDLRRSDWYNPKLEHLRYHRRYSPYTQDFSRDLSDHDWDIAEDEAAHFVRSISDPGEVVLLLTANRLHHFNSETRPVGGRYHFYFYLAAVGLLDRKGFDQLVPKEVVEDIVRDPPRILVAGFDKVPLANVFPELGNLRFTRYFRVRTFAHIWVYLRVPAPPSG